MKLLLLLGLFITSPMYGQDIDQKMLNGTESKFVSYIPPKKTNLFSLGWNSATTFSQPEFAGSSTMRGGEFDFQSYFRENISLGFSFAWHRFAEKEDRKTYVNGSASVSAVTWRYLEVNPVLVSVNYRKSLAAMPKLQWHLGLATGAYSVYQRLDFGIYLVSDRNWRWGFTPSAGLTYWG